SHQSGERLNEAGRIVESRSHVIVVNAKSERLLAILDIYFVECLYVIGDKRYRDNQHMSAMARSESAQGVAKRRRQPFGGADFALIAEMTCCRPSTVLPDEVHRALDLLLIRVTAFDCGHRHVVRAEDHIHIPRVAELV